MEENEKKKVESIPSVEDLRFKEYVLKCISEDTRITKSIKIGTLEVVITDWTAKEQVLYSEIAKDEKVEVYDLNYLWFACHILQIKTAKKTEGILDENAIISSKENLIEKKDKIFNVFNNKAFLVDFIGKHIRKLKEDIVLSVEGGSVENF